MKAICQALACVAAWLLSSAPAHAMHLSDGILPASWCVVWGVVALPLLAAALLMLRRRERVDAFYKPFLAMIAAAVFVVSCMPIPVPTAGTCSHPCGTALAAILVGPLMTVLITVVALLLQALLMAHGGLSTLGADVVSMGIAGGFAGWLAFKGARAAGLSIFAAGFLAGMLSDWATYATTSLQLALALQGDAGWWTLFRTIALAFVPTQLPLGILEGFLTGGALRFLHKRRPDILRRLGGGGMRIVVALLLALTLCTASVAEPGRWQGVDESVVERIAAENGRHPKPPIIEGDLLLFAFLIAGLSAGCVIGWYGRMLFADKTDEA